jgi:hypothetical protein
MGLLFLGGAANLTFAQGVQTGVIRGLVTDQQGLPIPAVTVTVSSPALQGIRSTQTGDDGTYVLRTLPPGDYDIAFEIRGFATVRLAGTVPLGGAVEVDTTLTAAGPTEQVQVTGQSPRSTDSPVTGLNIRQAEVEALATSRTLQGIATLSPGVNENTPDAGQISISGAFAFDNMFMLNGVDVNDNLFGDPQNLFIEDAIAETQVLTSGISAEYGRFSGGVVNAITKSGGNTFSGSYRINLTNPSWLDESPFEIENEIEHESELNQSQEATFGGPIVPDALWFFVAGRVANISTPNVFPQTGQDYTTQDKNRRVEVKMTGTAAPNQTFQGGYLNNYSESVDSPPLSFSIDRSTLLAEQRPNWYAFGNYRGVLGGNMMAEAQYSERRFRFEGFGGTDTNLVNSPILTGFILPTQEIGQYNAPYFDGNDPEERNNRQLTGSVTTFLEGHGRHELKVGGEFYRSQLTGGGGQSATDYVFYSEYLEDADGNPVRDAEGFLIPVFVPFVSEYDNWRPVRGAKLNTDTRAIYAQNHWTINRYMTADLGIRYEWARSETSDGLSGIDTSTITPRLAVAFDPTADGRFVVKTSYGHYSGRYIEPQVSANVNVGQPNVLFAFYTGPEGQGRDFAEGFDPANYEIYSGRFPTINVFFEDGLSSPVTKEFTLSAGGSIGMRGYAEATYVRRDTSDLVEDFIELRNGSTTVIEEGVEFGTFTNKVYRNSNLADRKFQSLVLQGRYNVQPNWTAAGSWTIQLKNEGNYVGEATGQPGLISVIGDYPEAMNEARHYPTGRLPSFQRHRVRLWSIYDWGMGSLGSLSLSGLLRIESGQVYSLVAGGLPLTDIQAELLAAYSDTPLSQDIYFAARGSESFRGYGALDVSVNYNIPIWQDVRPWVKFDVFNLLNNDKQIAWSTLIGPDENSAVDELGLPTGYVEGPDFGTATSDAHYPTPRQFRVAFGIRF